MHQHARDYATRGWRVIPITPGAKVPAIQRWTQQATTDTALINQWWQTWPNHGIGIATGPASGIFVVDIDVGPGKNGDDTWNRLEQEHGETETLEVLTGSGGRHLYFQWPPGLDIRNDAGRLLGPGIDIRGDGGQVLAPPTIHPNGTPYTYEISTEHLPPQPAPPWLLELLTTPPAATTPRNDRRQRQPGETLPGDRFEYEHPWAELLQADGATYIETRHHPDGPYELWARPGLPPGDLHASASLYYMGSDVLKVFTSNWPHLTQEATYTRFGYWAATRHGGDHHAAAAALGAGQATADAGQLLEAARAAAPSPSSPNTGYVPSDEVEKGDIPSEDIPANATPPTDEHPVLDDWGGSIVDWSTFWERDTTESHWLAEPFIAVGRSHVLYAGAKSGKSLLALNVAASLATGAPILGQPDTATNPVTVLYVDYEMTDLDLLERLDTFGYGPHSDLSHLHYALLPPIPVLDRPEGGKTVLHKALAVGAQLVIIDTAGRAVGGDENSADTIRAFYRSTGMLLKAAGIAVLRLDHSGKNKEKGQRGSSAKNDDVDVVWELSKRQGGVRLKATHQRMGWVPEEVLVDVEEGEGGFVTYTHAPNSKSGRYPEGTSELAELLDELKVPLDWGRDRARDALADAGHKVRNERLAAAIKWRKAAVPKYPDANDELIAAVRANQGQQPTPLPDPNGLL